MGIVSGGDFPFRRRCRHWGMSAAREKKSRAESQKPSSHRINKVTGIGFLRVAQPLLASEGRGNIGGGKHDVSLSQGAFQAKPAGKGVVRVREVAYVFGEVL
jgi:hypothetical protein